MLITKIISLVRKKKCEICGEGVVETILVVVCGLGTDTLPGGNDCTTVFSFHEDARVWHLDGRNRGNGDGIYPGSHRSLHCFDPICGCTTTNRQIAPHLCFAAEPARCNRCHSDIGHWFADVIRFCRLVLSFIISRFFFCLLPTPPVNNHVFHFLYCQ